MALRRSTLRSGFSATVLALLCATSSPADESVVNGKSGSDTCQTLEDIYGPTGNRFQAAIGFINTETTDSGTNPATVGYGLAVDDMVIEWREYNLIQDATDCAASGSCATLQLDTANIFGGQTSLVVTLLETTPYGTSPPPGPFVNCVATPGNTVCRSDCNLDGDFVDGADDADCDDNGTPDVVVKATSDVEALGEKFVLNRTAPGVYKGDIPVSSSFDAAGVLFVSQLGTDAPMVTVTYNDWQDGTNSGGLANKCMNDVDPAAQGQVQVATNVFLDTGSITVVRGLVDDVDGDNDDFADTNETVDLRLVVRNAGLNDVRNLIAQISTNDSKIDCILDSLIVIGDVPPRTTVTSTQAFRFKVANVNRTSVNLEFATTFNVTMASDNFDALDAPASVTIDLDYDVTSGGSGSTTFLEGFDVVSSPPSIGGSFIQENLDQGRNNFPASDGYRCQYSDSDWANSNSYGAITDCFLAGGIAAYWNRVTERAFAGTGSAYYGINLGGALGFTTPLGVLEAMRTANPINLSATGASELIFKHQTSLMDVRGVNARPGRTAGRAIIAVQRADAAGAAVGSWLKVYPYLNTYDQQAEDNYTNCMFDPVDDGNTEDDFFDPSDPDRRLGPSSTCFPEFIFAHQGTTEGPFAVGAIGRASEGPGLAGSVGVGTWIESKIDLSRFRGQRLRVRFLTTDIQGSSAQTWESIFQNNPDPADDGMWVDSVEVTNTLTTPATLVVDNDSFAGMPCGVVCNTVTPSVTTSPSPPILPAPGQVLEIDASASSADRCLAGTLQYRFCVSADNDCHDPGDTILRSWSDNPVLVVAPGFDTSYAVEVRCSSLPTCIGRTRIDAVVDSPGSPNRIKFTTPFNPASPTTGENTITWSIAVPFAFGEGESLGSGGGQVLTGDWIKGDFTTPATIGLFVEQSCDQTTGTGFDISAFGNPPPNSGFYFLAKRDGIAPMISSPQLINDITWRNFPTTASEASRDVQLNPNPTPDPGCP